MKLNQLTRLAKDAIDKRGGMDALKQDAQEARRAASGHGSLMDKARAAAGAFKEPGRDRGGEHGAAAPAPADRPSEPPHAASTPQAQPDPGPTADREPPRATS